MHDFLHIFRQYEFHKCVVDLQIPCRWAPDAGFEYGEPVFNFYGQLSYVLGEPFVLLGFSIINSVKIILALSMILSAFTMFLLAKQMWGSNLAALISSVFYVYAPYRAVDVWVRGALPEAVSFIVFPLVFWSFNNFIIFENWKALALFSLSLATLASLHNLSFLMFVLFFSVWIIYSLISSRKWYLITKLIFGFFLAFLITGFYSLPIIFESKFVNLNKLTSNYYDFRAHFASLDQLLFSRLWGYEPSVWGPGDNLSFSAGHLHWILSIILAIFVFIKRAKQNIVILLLVILGWFGLFLTHQRSAPLWEVFPILHFLQFPWRFLSISVLFFSLSAGSIIFFLRSNSTKVLATFILTILVVVFNLSFFKEDIWRSISDEQQFSGSLWDEQIAAALVDFWPTFGNGLPKEAPQKKTFFINGKGEVLNFMQDTNSLEAEIISESQSTVQFASVFFPGWQGFIDHQKTEVYPSGDLGLITVNLSPGYHKVLLKFYNTPVRTIGNLFTAIGLLTVLVLLLKKHNVKE